MVASLSFKKVDGQTDATSLVDIHTIIYKDNTGNKYTFGVENGTNTFNTFKYEPNSGGEVDYSAIAKIFMTNGAVGGLLGKLTTIETATNATNLGDKVAAIKTKTDKMPDDLETELDKLATSTSTLDGKVDTIKTETDKIADIVTNVGAIKTKTDKMPDDLEGELDTLAGFQYIDKLVIPLAKTADAIKAKTDKMPDHLGTDLTTIKTATNQIAAIENTVDAIKTKTDKMPDTLEANVTAIKAKTDTIPADLNVELGKLAKSTELAPLLTPLAKSAELVPLAKTADVDAIKAKTDKMPDDLGTDLTTIKTATNQIAAIENTVDAIKTKTDKMPADLNDELTKLTIIAKALNNNGDVTEAAKTVLGTSFKKAIEDAGEDGSNWLTNEIKEIASQPSFEIPQDSSEALSWDW